MYYILQDPRFILIHEIVVNLLIFADIFLHLVLVEISVVVKFIGEDFIQDFCESMNSSVVFIIWRFITLFRYVFLKLHFFYCTRGFRSTSVALETLWGKVFK
jgi:hypothetical protein